MLWICLHWIPQPNKKQSCDHGVSRELVRQEHECRLFLSVFDHPLTSHSPEPHPHPHRQPGKVRLPRRRPPSTAVHSQRGSGMSRDIQLYACLPIVNSARARMRSFPILSMTRWRAYCRTSGQSCLCVLRACRFIWVLTRVLVKDNRDAEAFLKPVSRADVPDYYDGVCWHAHMRMDARIANFIHLSHC